MPNTGGGSGTPLVQQSILDTPYDQTEELLSTPNCAVPLHRYAKLVGYEEASMWGVVSEFRHEMGCGPLWTEAQRFEMQIALAEAQIQIENFIGYPLCPTWVVGTVDEELNHDYRWVDQQRVHSRMIARYPRLLAAGVRAVDVLGDAVLTHTEKFGTLVISDVDFTDPNEVQVYYPGTNRRIYPNFISISGGDLTVQIPRYRLVVQDQLNTPEGGILYADMDSYLSRVNVLRVYNDPSKQASLVRPNCANNNCSGGCSECLQDGCIYIRDPYIGYIDVRPARWDSDSSSWSTAFVCGGNYSIARLYYLCGLRKLDLRAERAIVSLAHSKMMGPPCACDQLQLLWAKDNKYTDIRTRERVNCPFGESDGAWNAYVLAKSIASVRASIF